MLWRGVRRAHSVAAMRRSVLARAVAVAAAAAACGPVATRPASQDAGERHARAAASPAPRWPARARYSLDLAYDARRFTLAGTERIAFRNVGPTPLQSV